MLDMWKKRNMVFHRLAGLSIRKIGPLVGMSYQMVSNYLKTLGRPVELDQPVELPSMTEEERLILAEFIVEFNGNVSRIAEAADFDHDTAQAVMNHILTNQASGISTIYFQPLITWTRMHRITLKQLAAQVKVPYTTFAATIERGGKFKPLIVKRLMRVTGLSEQELLARPP